MACRGARLAALADVGRGGSSSSTTARATARPRSWRYVEQARSPASAARSGSGSSRPGGGPTGRRGGTPVRAVLRLGERPRPLGADWLASLAAELDAHPEAVLAYPLVQRIGEEGERCERPRVRSTRSGSPIRSSGCGDRAGDGAGDMIYGLHRVEALERAGGFPPTLLPDRLLLGRLALEGRSSRSSGCSGRAATARASGRRSRDSGGRSFPAGPPPHTAPGWPGTCSGSSALCPPRERSAGSAAPARTA